MRMRQTVDNVHRRALLIDAHCDTVGRVLDDDIDLRRDLRRGHMDIPKLIRGGVDAQFFACWIDPALIKTGGCVRRTLAMLDAFRRMTAGSGGMMEEARTGDDIRRIAGKGKIAALAAIEGGHAIDDDLGVLRIYHHLGVRYMTLTWMNNNNWADGSGDKPRHHGLTPFGRKVVREMERLGMMVDISHASEETFWDVLRIVGNPVIASHSCCRSLADHHRNLTDRQLKAVARNGGVVGINFYSSFLSDDFRRRAKGGKRANLLPLEVLVDHVVHATDVAGIDHVGLGSDFDGVEHLPEGMEDCSQFPNLTRRLLDRGLSAADVTKILGANFLRVISAVCRA